MPSLAARSGKSLGPPYLTRADTCLILGHVSSATIPHNIKSMTVPQRIKWLRKQAGSHDRLATKLGTTRQVVIRWEKGQRPSASSRARLAEVSGLPAAFFTDGDEDDEEEAELMAALVGNIRALVRAELSKREEVLV